MKPEPIQIATLPEVEQLKIVRLRNDWSIRQLRIEMAAVGIVMSDRTLQYLLMKTTTPHVPFARTLYKIRLFLELEQTARQERTHARAAAKVAGL